VTDQTKNSKDVTLGNYKILTKIGSGGMAAVYKAQDQTTGQLVALKVLSIKFAGHEAFVKRFLDESVAAARVNHPNIIEIHSLGEQEKAHHFFVMEYVENGSLARLLSGGQPVPAAQAVNYVLQAARGLRAAFRLGIVHRDVKPSNLLLTKEGTVKVADFGLAQLDGDDPPSNGERRAIGTPAYMSPEHATLGVVDHRSDIYSLGATLFHLVTGRQPFRAETPREVVLKHGSEPLPSPRELNPDLPPSLCNVIQKMMAKWPVDRYQTYDALIADLEWIQTELNQRPAPAARPARRHRRAAAFAIDNALVFLPAALIVLCEEGRAFFETWSGLHAVCTMSLLALTVYSTVMLARFGRTLGMRAMGLRLSDARGRPPWWGAALVRSLTVNVFYLFLMFPADPLARIVILMWGVDLAASLGESRQPWHDELCGTRVTEEGRRQ